MKSNQEYLDCLNAALTILESEKSMLRGKNVPPLMIADSALDIAIKGMPNQDVLKQHMKHRLIVDGHIEEAFPHIITDEGSRFLLKGGYKLEKWYQKPENIRWLITTFIAILALILSLRKC